MRKENRETLGENRMGAGERQNRRVSQHCFQRALASTTETVAKINVTFKINSHFFKLCRVYSTLLKMQNVGEFHRSGFHGDPTKN